MNTVTFDTHKIITQLTQRGFSKDQAEGMVEVLTENEFVTESALERQTSDLTKEIRTQIAEAKFDMIKWTAGMLIAQAAVIVALLELL